MIRKMISLMGSIFTILLFVAVIVSIIFLLKAKTSQNQVPYIFGYRLMVVLSGSMRPMLEPGDMVLIKQTDSKNVQVGDVVTYKSNQGIYVTHRIMSIHKGNNELVFKTKGDANNVEDDEFASQRQLTGLMVMHIPYGGYVARTISSPVGLAVLVFLAVCIIAAGEIKKIMLREKEAK